MCLFVVNYCSSECQRADWANHRSNCMPVRVENVGTSGIFKRHAEYISMLHVYPIIGMNTVCYNEKVQLVGEI